MRGKLGGAAGEKHEAFPIDGVKEMGGGVGD